MTDLTPMRPEMMLRVSEAIRRGLASSPTEHYVDQTLVNSKVLWVHFYACYTPFGVACIESAFLDRMVYPNHWDSKDLIRSDILSNPHLHQSIKDRLLLAFEATDWAKWYDSYYARKMSHEPLEGLRDSILRDTNLTEASRENLLYNLDNRHELS